MAEKKKEKLIKHVQIHDAFTPIGSAALLSLSVEGARAFEKLVEDEHGVLVFDRNGRQFLIPFANIASLEYLP